MLTLEKFEEASEVVKQVTTPTKLVYSEYLSAQTGARIYLKPENMQHTGAYKLRGAYYKISTLSEEDRNKGLITASAGNHAQGVAYAAKRYGCKATIVMPTGTPLIKVNRTKSYGAEVILHGDVYDDACAYAYKLAEEHGYTFVHPFDDLDVATGQGSIAMEIIQELPTVDYILVPIGGGGLENTFRNLYIIDSSYSDNRNLNCFFHFRGMFHITRPRKYGWRNDRVRGCIYALGTVNTVCARFFHQPCDDL